MPIIFQRDMLLMIQVAREMKANRKEKHYLYLSSCYDAKYASQQKAFVKLELSF